MPSCIFLRKKKNFHFVIREKIYLEDFKLKIFYDKKRRKKFFLDYLVAGGWIYHILFSESKLVKILNSYVKKSDGNT